LIPLTLLAILGLVAWVAVLAAPWQPHRARERLEPADPEPSERLDDVCVLIPARDEAALIPRTIAALRRQGPGLEVILVDDQSADGTAARASEAAAAGGEPLPLRIVAGRPLPAGWAGKLWALEQGLAIADRPYTLLVDADIELGPGMVAALRRRAEESGAVLVSIMATLRCTSFWERLLSPPFVFFFKLLYPFALANDPGRRTAAAAGGCMLVRTDALRAVGGFAAIRAALIDDCALAAVLKRAGGATWLGLSRSVRSLRAYDLGSFWSMVSRTAFTQLRYSSGWLIGATIAIGVVLIAPPALLVAWLLAGAPAATAAVAALAWLALAAAYLPTVRFYGLNPAWALTLPAAAALFLAMTWASALRYWRGTRATWKNRSYEIDH
jgi:hopene-associated glycosyltransferase HpnB